MGIFLDDVVWTKESPNGDFAINNYTNTGSAPTSWEEVHLEQNKIRSHYSNYWNVINKLKEQNIIKIIFAFFDDIICGKYKGVNISIYETNTNPFESKLFPFMIFLGVFMAILFGGCLTLIAFLLFISLLLFLAKIFGNLGCYIFVGIVVLLVVRIIFIVVNFILERGFKGVVVEIDMNKSFKGHTFFHDNSFSAKKIKLNKKIYKKVNLESPTFENKYNVYSNDQVEARYILTTALMERIENLKFAFKSKYVRGSFKDNKLTLAIHTGKDMFAMGSDFKDSNTHTFEMLYDEMISILQIVDELKLNEHTGL